MPRAKNPHFSVVVPCYNEGACIAELTSRLTKVLDDCTGTHELIFVNDGSHDDTQAKIEALAEADARIKHIRFSRNFGHQMALTAGLEHAGGDAVISLDGDLQHPPELIPELIRYWDMGYDVVYTVRESNQGHAAKEFVSRAFYWLLRKLTGVSVPTGGADFRLMDKRVADALRDCDERFVFVRGLVPWLGFKRKGIAYQAEPRYGGSTKYKMGRMLSFGLDGVFSFSIVPLRLIAFIGTVTIVLGVVYAAYTLAVRLFTDTAVSGWTSLMIVVLVFSGTQLLSLGILSEYVGRIYEEVKHRPRYVIADKSESLGRTGTEPRR